jgi:hypothetical protein
MHLEVMNLKSSFLPFFFMFICPVSSVFKYKVLHSFFIHLGVIFSGCNGAALPKCIFGVSWGAEFSKRMQLCSCRINYTSSNCNICLPIFLRDSSESVSTIQSSGS